MNFKQIASGFLLACIACQSYSQVTAQSGGYLLRFKYTAKQKMVYKMNISSAMMKTPMGMSMTMLTKSVSGIQAEVEYTVKSTGGATAMPEQKMTATVDNRGRIIKSSTAGAGQFSNLQLPEKAVRLGDTWTGSMNMSGMTAKSSYKLVGIKTVAGVPCAQIAVSVTGGMAQMKVTGSGTMYIRMVDGSLQTSNVATMINMTPPNGQNGGKPMSIKTDITISRQ